MAKRKKEEPKQPATDKCKAAGDAGGTQSTVIRVMNAFAKALYAAGGAQIKVGVEKWFSSLFDTGAGKKLLEYGTKHPTWGNVLVSLLAYGIEQVKPTSDIGNLFHEIGEELPKTSLAKLNAALKKGDHEAVKEAVSQLNSSVGVASLSLAYLKPDKHGNLDELKVEKFADFMQELRARDRGLRAVLGKLPEERICAFINAGVDGRYSLWKIFEEDLDREKLEQQRLVEELEQQQFQAKIEDLADRAEIDDYIKQVSDPDSEDNRAIRESNAATWDEIHEIMYMGKLYRTDPRAWALAIKAKTEAMMKEQNLSAPPAKMLTPYSEAMQILGWKPFGLGLWCRAVDSLASLRAWWRAGKDQKTAQHSPSSDLSWAEEVERRVKQARANAARAGNNPDAPGVLAPELALEWPRAQEILAKLRKA